MEWEKEKAAVSNLADKPIRWLFDDVSKFIAREVRRANSYDAIVMDPPAFGHGPKNELWKFERDMPILLEEGSKNLNTKKGPLVLNAYSMGYPLVAVEQLVRSTLPFVRDVEMVELCLEETTDRKFVLPAGVVVRATW